MRKLLQNKIDKANDLAQQIEAADTRPRDLIAQFNQVCDDLRKRNIDLTTHVKCPSTWAL